MYNEEFKKYQMLSEQYYGKNKLLEEIDKAFDRIIANRGEYNLTSQLVHDNFLPDLKIISKNFKTIFNFKDVALYIKANGMVNACTMTDIVQDSNGIKSAMNTNRRLGKYGLEFSKPDRTAIIQINFDLLFMEGMTGRHLTCIILHEVGHNFFIEDSLGFISKFIALDVIYMNFINSMMNNKEFKINYTTSILRMLVMSSHELTATMLKQFHITDKSPLTKLIRAIEEVTMSSLSLFGTLKHLALPFLDNYKFTSPGKRIVLALVNVFNPSNLSLYKNEQFSDNFATSYGYGPEMIEVRNMFMKNLTTGNYAIDKGLSTAILPNAFYDFMGAYTDLLTDPLKSRSDDYVEAIDQINYLKALLNNESYDEKRKKQIKKDLDEAETNLKIMHKQFLSFSKDGYLRKGKVMTAVNKSIYAVIGGDIGYKIRGKGYDNKGNWKYMI